MTPFTAFGDSEDCPNRAAFIDKLLGRHTSKAEEEIAALMGSSAVLESCRCGCGRIVSNENRQIKYATAECRRLGHLALQRSYNVKKRAK